MRDDTKTLRPLDAEELRLVAGGSIQTDDPPPDGATQPQDPTTGTSIQPNDDPPGHLVNPGGPGGPG